ncbi:hypothetical protein SDC9_195667 [bioreactor metagenome]|uniref:Uncharacterized protein n=1 Tax=bioreactor metagenome TaxID=1076179 RepID=A0A645IL59_9ZZZZ
MAMSVVLEVGTADAMYLPDLVPFEESPLFPKQRVRPLQTMFPDDTKSITLNVPSMPNTLSPRSSPDVSVSFLGDSLPGPLSSADGPVSLFLTSSFPESEELLRSEGIPETLWLRQILLPSSHPPG